MINYNDQNEAVKGVIDNLTAKYTHDMREFPLSWVECAYNRARQEKALYMLELTKRNNAVYYDTDSIKVGKEESNEPE